MSSSSLSYVSSKIEPVIAKKEDVDLYKDVVNSGRKIPMRFSVKCMAEHSVTFKTQTGEIKGVPQKRKYEHEGTESADGEDKDAEEEGDDDEEEEILFQCPQQKTQSASSILYDGPELEDIAANCIAGSLADAMA